jgi:DNA repair protein RadD
MLRDYQSETLDKLRSALAGGSRRPVVQAPTGAGKTIIAAEIVRMALLKGKRVIFTVPAISLIDQTVERFAGQGIYQVGVMQGAHELTDRDQPVQVCSVQTLARRTIPKADLVIMDEVHVQFKLYDTWMQDPAWASVPFIGLTATPWAKGMGAKGRWDKLIVCTTTQDLINRGHLSDFKVYAPSHPDLSGVKTVAGDYDVGQLGQAMDKRPLVADIVSTWLEKGEDRPTICFAVNRTHAKHIQTLFSQAGVAAEYMDAYTDRKDRNEIVARFQRGEVRVICNVGVLTTGFDADVRCIILARPTKSEMLYCQMIGRGLRTAEGKDHCIILDHSDTTLRLGFVTDIHKSELDDGKKKATAAKNIPLPKECPKCSFVKPPKTRVCPACGFAPEAKSEVDVNEGDLHELTRDRKMRVKDWPPHKKSLFWAELLLHAHLRGYKPGWAYWAYKERMGVGPANTFSQVPAKMISPETEAWIRHYNIKKAKGREKTGRAA